MKFMEKFTGNISGKRIISFLGQAILVVALFLAVTAWQGRNLIKKGEPVRSFTLMSIDGKEYRLDNDRKVLLYFFAPWCSVCKFTSGNIENFRHSKAGRERAVYAIALSWQSPEEVRAYARSQGLTVPVLLGGREIAEEFRISVFPTFYFIDRSGRVASHVTGYTTEFGLWFRSTFGLF